MSKCPECNGKGKKKINYAEMTTSQKPPEYRIETCRVCGGKGSISDLSLGVYKARGEGAVFLNRWDQTIKEFDSYEEAQNYANNNIKLVNKKL